MKQKLTFVAGFALALVVLFGGVAGAIPALATSYPVGGTQYYLAGAGVNASQTAIQLTSFKTADGRLITMSMFGTIGYGALDPQTTAKLEDIEFTGITQNANGTATLTGVLRGQDFVYPYAATPSLGKSHSGGATFILTNTAGYYFNEFTMNNNNNLFTWPTASTSPATKGYVDYIAFSGPGVIPATTIAPGVSQLATQVQTASSTATNGGGYNLVIQSANATSTYNALTAPLRVVVTQNSGKIDSNFIATSTLGLPTGSSTPITYLASTTWTKPANMQYAVIETIGSGGSGGIGTSNPNSQGGGGGGGGYCKRTVPASALGATETVTVGTGGAAVVSGSGTSGNNGSTSSFGTWCSSTGGGGGGGSNTTAAGGAGGGGLGSSGDINGVGGAGGVGTVGPTSSTQQGGSGGYGQYGLGAGGKGGFTASVAGSNGAIVVTEYF